MPAPPLAAEKVARIRELRVDGYTYRQVARIVGCGFTTIRRYAPGRIGKVPVAPLREAFLRSPMTAAEVARDLGWWAGKDADSARVKRTLGLRDDCNGAGRHSRRTVADAETVRLIAEVIGVPWWSVMPDDDRPAWAREDEAA